MKERFEIPIPQDSRQYNLFAIDDFLRSIQTSERRQKLITSVGLSPTKRAAFEKKGGLPHGAVELAMMMEDRRIQEINQIIHQKLPLLYSKDNKQEEVLDLYEEIASLSVGLRNNYPDATSFLVAYARLSERTRRSFQGDYRFSSEYRMLQAQDGGSNPPPDPPANLGQWLSVIANVVGLVNVFVYTNLVLATLALAAAAAVVWAAVVVPIYGQNRFQT